MGKSGSIYPASARASHPVASAVWYVDVFANRGGGAGRGEVSGRVDFWQ